MSPHPHPYLSAKQYLIVLLRQSPSREGSFTSPLSAKIYISLSKTRHLPNLNYCLNLYYFFMVTSSGANFKDNKNKYILTPRQLEYLTLAALGFNNYKISKLLFVSKSTVKKMLEEIFRRLKAKDRTNAVAIALIHKLISTKFYQEMSNIYSLKLSYTQNTNIIDHK